MLNIKLYISSALASFHHDPLAFDQAHRRPCLSHFAPVTDTEVERLFALMSTKSSPLDFVPTSVIKACRGTFAHIIARLANLSFDHATFPARFRMAQVTPLIKKHGLDKNDPGNYRPISNPNTVSKIIERLALARIAPHVTTSPSFDPMQSAYRRRHSTETALLKITNDIYEGFDNRQSTILFALDQSAAFDRIDHSTLISRLQHTFGVTGQVLAWLSSYLQSRQSFVRWDDASSATSVVAYSVPQGSSLGPLLFSLYIAPFSAVIQSFGLMHHQYADDTQIYISVPSDELAVKVDCLERCTTGVHIWLLSTLR